MADTEPQQLDVFEETLLPAATRAVTEYRDPEDILREQEALLDLLRVDVPKRIAERAIKRYGADAVTIIRRNPWVLAHGFNLKWAQADGIARIGFDRTERDPQRIGSSVFTELQSELFEGHCYGIEHAVTRAAAVRCNVPQDYVREVLRNPERLFKPYPIELEGEKKIWLGYLLADERRVALAVGELKRQRERGFTPVRPPEGLGEEQLPALQLLHCASVGVITGGPGVGKTTVLKEALATLRSSIQVALCAPTGKAARRMQEVTGREAHTIHRLLGFRPGFGFTHHEHNPLDADLVVCDEASMVDVRLAARLLRAVDPRRTRVLFVGDVDQLPPVGPGAFFRDLIESGTVPVVRLSKLYRQAAESWICRNAPRILAGGKVELEDCADFEFWDVTGGAANAVAPVLIDIFKKILAEDAPALELNARDPWQLFVALTPMRKQGVPLATSHLNPTLQQQFNANRTPALDVGDNTYRVGDRVIQTKNDYELDVRNGDQGAVTRVYPGKEATLVVQFDHDDREVVYRGDAKWNLQLAYALTGHKSQGSEWPIVVVVCHSSHGFMLSRKWLYTAITRAKKKLYLLGDEPGVRKARQTIKDDLRRTTLKARLQA